MASTPPATPSLRQLIAANGWEQGKLIDPAATVALLQTAISLDPTPVVEPIGVVISQTCDLLAPQLVKEPHFDLIVAEQISAVEYDFAEARNPRQLDLSLLTPQGERGIRLRMGRRAFAARDWLANNQPSKQSSLLTGARRHLIRWLRDRYARTPLPDAFADRIDAQKKTCAKALRDVGIHRLWLALNPMNELQAEHSYSVALLLTLPPNEFGDVSKRQAAEKALLAITTALAKCSGIEVINAKIESDSAVSLHDITAMLPFGYEYLSVSDDAPTT